MIDDRLRDTFDRVAAGGPDEAGAFDRFLRHRRVHRSRRLAGATALVLVVVLASAVAVPRLLTDPGRRLVVTGAAGPERWLAGPMTVVAPLQGFEVEVPDGWEANATWKGVALRPASRALRRHLRGPVQLVNGVLEQSLHPAPAAGRDGAYLGRVDLPTPVVRRPEGRHSRGSFPGGRSWFRADLQDGRWRTTQWHIAWPYRCQRGVRCPALLALRTLKVAYRVDGDAAQVDGLAERLLGTARPIANAVIGQAHAPRPACVSGRSMMLWLETDDPLPGGRVTTVSFWGRAWTTANLAPCTVRSPFGVELLDSSGRRLEVQGNPLTVTLAGELPEAIERLSGRPSLVELQLKWSNWCGGGEARMRWIGGPGPEPAVPTVTPACFDRTKPSRLLVEHTSR